MATAPVKKPSRPVGAPAPAVEPSRGLASLSRLSSRTTLLLGLAGLVLIAAVSYGWYIRHGGLFDDDWAGTSAMFGNRADGGGYWSGVREAWNATAWRPVLVLYGSLIVGPLGWHLTAQFLWVIAVSTVFVGLLFQVLRVRGIPSPHAFAISALALVSTFGDAGVLWISGGGIRFGGALYLAGLLMALGALRTEDQPRALRLHIGAGVLYVLAILTYEVTAGFLWAGILVYLGVAPRRQTLRRWGADLAISVVGLAWSAANTPRPSHSLSATLDHAGAIVREYWKLYDGVVAPSWLPDHAAGVLTLVALAVAAAYLGLRARGRIAGAHVDAVCRWAVVLGVALVYVAAAYVIFAPGDAYYLPNGLGTSNRMNTLAAAPTILVGYAAVMVLVTAVLTVRRRWLTAAMGVGLLYGAGMFITNERALRADEHVWAGDYAVSRGVLDTIHATVPRPARGSYIITLGVPASRPSGNPVFYAAWDLDAAVKKLYGDGSVRAFNAYQGVDCGPDGLVVPGGSSGGYSTEDTSGAVESSLTTDYGRTVVVDAVRHKAYPLADALSCQRAHQAISGG